MKFGITGSFCMVIEASIASCNRIKYLLHAAFTHVMTTYRNCLNEITLLNLVITSIWVPSIQTSFLPAILAWCETKQIN